MQYCFPYYRVRGAGGAPHWPAGRSLLGQVTDRPAASASHSERGDADDDATPTNSDQRHVLSTRRWSPV